MTKILNPKDTDSIYDPACGTGGMLLEAINQIKEKPGYDSNSDAQAMVSFLENIDTNPSSWWTETQPVVNYIY